MAKHLFFGIPAFSNRGTRTGTGFVQVGASLARPKATHGPAKGRAADAMTYRIVIHPSDNDAVTTPSAASCSG